MQQIPVNSYENELITSAGMRIAHVLRHGPAYQAVDSDTGYQEDVTASLYYLGYPRADDANSLLFRFRVIYLLQEMKAVATTAVHASGRQETCSFNRNIHYFEYPVNNPKGLLDRLALPWPSGT